MMNMIMLAVTGLCMGSFINALIWRVHKQEEMEGRVSKKKNKEDYSILKGRSMCPHCRHELAVQDLLPVISWLMLRGKCRYCGKAISTQYPLVELVTALLFAVSYLFWPYDWSTYGTVLFIFWLVFLVGLITLAVYDLKWFLLPNRIVFPLIVVGGFQAFYLLGASSDILRSLSYIGLSVLVAGGIFCVLFQVSKGRWIGGGDVKLGILLGLIHANPWASVLTIFISSLLGSLVSLPLLAVGRVKRSSHIPYGPFLIVAAIIVELFGAELIKRYMSIVLR